MNERIHSTISMAIRRRCMTHVLCTCMKNDPISQLRPQQCRAPWSCCSELSAWLRPCTRAITAWAAWCATEIWASPSGAKMTRAFWSASRPGARPPHHLRSPRYLMTQTGFVKYTQSSKADYSAVCHWMIVNICFLQRDFCNIWIESRESRWKDLIIKFHFNINIILMV